MPSIINSTTTSPGGLISTGDSSNSLLIQTGDTTAITINESQVVSLTNPLPAASGGTGLSSFPAPGTTGNVLTSNGTAWTSAALSVLGGATEVSSATDITLTSASNRVQAVSMTAIGQYVILPNATTMTVGSPIFVIRNNGATPFGIKTSDGKIIIYDSALNSGSEVTLSLSNTSSAISGWGYKVYGYGVTATPATIISTNQAPYDITRLSDTAVLMTYIANSDSDLYAVVGSVSSNVITWGTPQAVVSGVTASLAYCIGLTATTAIVGYTNSGNTSIFYGLTISGTSITVSTASATSTTTLITDLKRVSDTTAIVGYYTATQFSTRIVTHNGSSAPSLGTAVNIAANSLGTVDLAVRTVAITELEANKFAVATYDPGSANGAARIQTVSGTTITQGTAITGSGIIPNDPNLVAVSATEFLDSVGVLFTVSGTTVTRGNQIVGLAGIGVSNKLSFSDSYVVNSASRAIVYRYINSTLVPLIKSFETPLILNKVVRLASKKFVVASLLGVAIIEVE